MKIKKIFFIIFILIFSTSNSFAMEVDVFIKSTLNRATTILSKDISKDDKIKELKILASDISLDALNVATINLQNYQVKNVLLIQSNWLAYAKTESLDLVISNPPYLKSDDRHLKDLAHEPQSALVSPKGTKSFLEISQQAFIALKHEGRIIFEHGSSQRLEVTAILKDCGFKNIISGQDLQGLDRFIYAQKL